MKPQLLSTAILCGALCAALTPPSRPLAARGLTTSLAAGASGPQRQILLVAAGVLAKSGRVLLQQRSDPPQLAGLWEFPGGKVEAQETDALALRRELIEKIGAGVQVKSLSLHVTHEYERYTLDLLVYKAELDEGTEPQALHVAEVRWVSPADFGDYQFPGADQQTIDALLSE